MFAGNVSRRNGGDGLYFCSQVVGIIVTGNLFHDNGTSGVGGLGAGGAGDRFNVVTDNVCRHNGRWGIQAVGGRDNVISGNIGIEEQGSSDANVITGNLCQGNREGGIAVVGLKSEVSANLGPLARRQP